jgi:hypothetical protein
MGTTSDAIYLSEYTKQLDPDQVGIFEPVSGLMLINRSKADYAAAAERYAAGDTTSSDEELFRAINHEIFHFAQTVGSGYGFDRQRQLFAIIDKHENWSGLEERVAFRKAEPFLRRIATDRTDIRRGGDEVLTLLTQGLYLARMAGRAAPEDHTWVGAMIPPLLQRQQELVAAEAETNEAGLSTIALLEGSAIVHTELLMGGLAFGRSRIEAQLATLPPVYRLLLDTTVRLYGDRAVELLLPTTALALRYARPHNAYLTLLPLVAESEEGDAVICGRTLCANLPRIPAAEPLLGTAIDVHRETAQSSRLYSMILRDLADGKWNVDSYTVLADPAAMHLLPSFPVGMILQDGYQPGEMDRAEFGARTMVMSFMLHVHSRSRDEVWGGFRQPTLKE